MPTIKCKNGNVLDVDEALAADLVAQGHALVAAGSEPDEESEGEAGGEPDAPHGNASREAWAAYADRLGVEYPEGAKQKEIRELVAARGGSEQD